MSSYEIKHNAKTIHIAGLTCSNKISSDGLTYSRSACAALSRGSYLRTDSTHDSVKAAFEAANELADIAGLNICKSCTKAASVSIQEEEEEDRKATDNPVETEIEATVMVDHGEDGKAVAFMGGIVTEEEPEGPQAWLSFDGKGWELSDDYGLGCYYVTGTELESVLAQWASERGCVLIGWAEDRL